MFDTAINQLAGLPALNAAPKRDLVTAVATLHHVESTITAWKLAYTQQLFAQFQTHPVIGLDGIAEEPWDATETELGPALAMTPRGAESLVMLAHSLLTRLPRLWERLAAGTIDLYRVRVIVSATANVTDEHIAEVERRILQRLDAAPATICGSKLRGLADKVIAHVDADGLRRRRRDAERGRWVDVRNDGDGMAQLIGSLPAADGIYLTNRLGEMAKQVCTNDPRSFQARRADALIALSRGIADLDCLCGQSGCHNRVHDLGDPRKPLVHVITTPETITGEAESGARATPGWIDGFGIIDADHVREIATQGRLRDLRMPTPSHQPEPRARPIKHDRSTDYRLSQDLSDWIRAAFGTCQFPGCTRPAWQTDIDHRDPFNHQDPKAGGLSLSENLGPLCRRHHTGKTLGHWHFERMSAESQASSDLWIVTTLGFRYPCTNDGPISLLTDLKLDRNLTIADPPKRRTTRTKQRQQRTNRERKQVLDERTQHQDRAGPPPF